MPYCDNQFCEADAVKAVPVSGNSYGDDTRNYCPACENAYTSGAQHATYRTAFRFADAIAEVMEMNLIEDILPRLALFEDSDNVREKALTAWRDAERKEEEEEQ